MVLIFCLLLMVLLPCTSLVVTSTPNSAEEESSSNFTVEVSSSNFTVEASSYDYSLYISKDAEYKFLFWWFFGWELYLQIDGDVAYQDPLWYFTYHNEWYSTSCVVTFAWQEYSVSKQYSTWGGKIYKIKYTVSGKFYDKGNSNSYYEITLMITLYASGSTDHQFGPFYNHLQGDWRFHENWGLL
ncbi:MAG: hypothetical protein ACFE8N_08780 [Promethearchaeota archaeon]